MDPLALATRVAAVPRRRAGSDAERRAAELLAAELRATGRRRRRTTAVQTVWVRPHHGLVHAVIAAAAVVGSVLSVAQPLAGLVLAAGALILLAGDLSGRLPLVRRLTVARATQNVVSRDRREAPVRLVVTASVDAPAPGPLGRGGAARSQARLRRALRGHLPGPYGVMTLALVALVACTAARELGAEGIALGAVQLVPTVLLLLAVAAGLEQALAQAPAAGANVDASAAAVAVALVAALDADPPRALAVDCVLAGAGSAEALGLRRWIAGERRAGVRAEQVAVLHLAACGAGTPVFWERDGLVAALRFHPRLTAIARDVAARRPALHLRAHESRGTSGARAARAVGWPAIAVGCVDEFGVAPRLGTEDDTADRLEAAALEATLEACLALVRALDAELSTAAAPSPGGAPSGGSPPGEVAAGDAPPGSAAATDTPTGGAAPEDGATAEAAPEDAASADARWAGRAPGRAGRRRAPEAPARPGA